MPKNRIKVYARFKPTHQFPSESIQYSSNEQTITIHPKKEGHSYLNNVLSDLKFTVDGILLNSTQEEVYEKAVSKMTTKALEGFNCTLLAYGQTGAGKTYTISGATENYKLRGIIPRTLSKIFSSTEEQQDQVINVRISYMEIYNENAYDLLSTMPGSEVNDKRKPTNKLHVNDNNLSFIDNPDGSVFIRGLSIHAAGNEGDALNLFFEGETNRSIAAHSLNKNSSRSHCIFTIYIESRSRSESNAKYITSKFHLVDLAGSERINKTKSEGQTKVEALYINKSLSYLEQTVTAMAEPYRTHIPYRQTKLTHALKDSLGGRCPTTLICNIYADEAYLEETMATLRFGCRMMRIPVHACRNELLDPLAKVNELTDVVKALKLELSMHDALANRVGMEYEPLSEGQLVDIKNQVRHFMEGKTSDIDVQSMRHLNAIFTQFRYIANSMEKEVMMNLKHRFVLVDKSDQETINMLQKIGFNLDDDTNFAESNFGGHQISESKGLKQSKNQQAKESTKKRREKSTKSKYQGSSSSKPSQVLSSSSLADAPTGGSKSDRSKKESSAFQDKQQVERTQTQQMERPSVKEHENKEKSANREGIDSARRDGSLGSTESVNAYELDKKTSSRPGTPPGKSEAFEEFKRERGKEIARILNENKTIFQSKKRTVRDLAHAVNASKHMIDGARIALERKRQERLEQGEFVDEEGELVIDEEEFELISQLKSLKQTYRSDYNELRNVKSEVEYCEKLVKQCRERLVREFDNWYNEMFLNDGEILSNTVNNNRNIMISNTSYQQNKLIVPAQLNVEDEQEKFDRLQQETMLEEPDATAFLNAQLRTRRRKILEKSYQQTQPDKNKSVGTPRISIRNRPPNQLSYIY